MALLAPAMQNGGETSRQLIDNNRVTVREVTAASTPLGSRNYDVVAIDLDAKTAVFVAKGTTRAAAKHAIVVDLKDVTVFPIQNKTPYPLAFPRPGVKKLVDNNRVFVWDYTWTPGKPTPMHFHDKDVVVVYLADGQLKSTTPDGKSEINTISFGLTRFNAPNRTHTEELIKGSARAIIVELK
jgi:quercetin dioxygenase-like cupin family protein